MLGEVLAETGRWAPMPEAVQVNRGRTCMEERQRHQKDLFVLNSN